MIIPVKYWNRSVCKLLLSFWYEMKTVKHWNDDNNRTFLSLYILWPQVSKYLGIFDGKKVAKHRIFDDSHCADCWCNNSNIAFAICFALFCLNITYFEVRSLKSRGLFLLLFSSGLLRCMLFWLWGFLLSPSPRMVLWFYISVTFGS